MPELPFSIIWQDEYLLVVNKPPYVSVTTSETEKSITLVEMISQHLSIPVDRAGIVHRLDKNTTGLLLIAKTTEVFEALQLQFKERIVKKEYLALVHGKIEQDGGEIIAPIGRNPINREKFVVMEGGRDSSTKFHVEARYVLPFEKIDSMIESGMTKKEKEYYKREAIEYTFVRLFPKTGRTHQIRVHMKYIHHPLVADEVYTSKKLLRFDSRWCPRQFLHATKLTFIHPITQEVMTMESPLYPDLADSLQVFA